VNLLGLILISLALGVLAYLGFLWSVRSGQYEDPEGPKYRMLDDDEEPPPAGGPGPRAGEARTGDGPDDAPRDPPQGQKPDGP
jgi:cbb3-type cytochrome oxidase maturation protein